MNQPGNSLAFFMDILWGLQYISYIYLNNLNMVNHKIKSIKEKVPQVTTLPDGLYNGTWGGYVIELNYKSKTYELETEVGVRGIGIKVVVKVENGIATFNTIEN